ncbi:MAG: hypothetical protein IKC16_07220 [Clostridia bacterium]|nr:hypothetical protein [Clostridia bacterium]
MFCRNCGKDIGESNFCPECGTKSNVESASIENNDSTVIEDVQAERSVVYGEYGEIIAEDGRKIFQSPKHAIKVSRKSNALYKVSTVLMLVAMPAIIIGFIFAFLSLIPNFGGMKILAYALVFIGATFALPSSLLTAFAEKKHAKWLKEQNVDVRKTITRGTGTNQKYTTLLLYYNHIKDVKSAFALSIIHNIISIVSLIVMLFIIPTIRFSYYGALSLIMLVAVEIPIIVISKIREKKATTHYEQNTK